MVVVLRPILLAALLLILAACAPAGTVAGEPTVSAEPAVASTLEPRIQLVVRQEIERALAEWQPAAAVVVVLDPGTGAILAMEGRDGGRDEPMLASRRAYVTGSTLKTFTIAAALDAQTIDRDAHVDCAPRRYGEAKLVDPTEHGSLSVSEVLAVSSNVGTSRIYDTLGLDRLLASLRRFHIGDPPAELPTVSDGASIQAAILAAGELARATPLQVAAGYAAIFNDGIYTTPTFARANKAPERVLRPETARTMIAMLEKTIASDLGTGKLARIDGKRVAGKTGTADLDHGRIYASFVGTVLDQERHFVVLVGLEAPRDGGTGPTAAAPIFARIARRL